MLALAMFSPTALAVSVSPQGIGQVLLYPYYTARSSNSGGAYSTLFIVTNTTADTKIVRVRFRESRNGREVASLNVFLKSYDSWTGAVLAGPQGPLVDSNDQSCVDPPLLGNPPSMVFSNAQYSGANGDGEDGSLGRAAEGYFEIFDMGVVKDPMVLAALHAQPAGGFIEPSTPNCPAALAVPLDNVAKVGAPSGGLIGNADIISVNDGTLYSYDATALANFSLAPLWAPPASVTPTLADVNPKISQVFDASGYRESAWDAAKGAHVVDPVSAVLMHDQLLNWFVRDRATKSRTDWIVTMPTKPFYVTTVSGGGGVARPPFESNFWIGGAPDFFGFYPLSDCRPTPVNSSLFFDREGFYSSPSACFLPPPPQKVLLPWTVNVVTFQIQEGSIFGSAAIAPYANSFENGWAKLVPFQHLDSHVHQLVSTDASPVTYFGLPMIGFMANDFVNGTLTIAGRNVLANYSATSQHKGIARIQ